MPFAATTPIMAALTLALIAGGAAQAADAGQVRPERRPASTTSAAALRRGRRTGTSAR